MKPSSCENEARVLQALESGLKAEAMDAPLRLHVAGCPSCAELISVYELFQHDSAELCATARVPEAGRVWWRATMAARRATAERALRPILIAEKTALAVSAGALIALLIFAAPWIAEQVSHTSALKGAFVLSLPLSSLVVASFSGFILVLAGAIYTLWAEK